MDDSDEEWKRSLSAECLFTPPLPFDGQRGKSTAACGMLGRHTLPHVSCVLYLLTTYLHDARHRGIHRAFLHFPQCVPAILRAYSLQVSHRDATATANPSASAIAGNCTSGAHPNGRREAHSPLLAGRVLTWTTWPDPCPHTHLHPEPPPPSVGHTPHAHPPPSHPLDPGHRRQLLLPGLRPVLVWRFAG